MLQPEVTRGTRGDKPRKQGSFVIEDDYRGYDFLSRHPCTRTRHKIELGPLRDTNHIDAWLDDHLGVDDGGGPRHKVGPEKGRQALALAVVDRALLLYGELLRVSRIPCFDKGRVLQLRAVPQERGSYDVITQLPVLDNVPIASLLKLFRDCLHLVLNRLSRPPTPQAVEALFTLLDEVVTLLKGSSFGTSTLPICRMAFQHDVPFRHVGNGLVLLGWGARSQLLHRSAVERDSAIGANASGNKLLTARLLRAAGLPVPENMLVSSPEAALAAARQLGWPVVVKPSDLEQSRGVTTDIATEAELLAAYERARADSEHILVERHVPGICHRIMVTAGQLIYTVSRLPKGVRANGRDTVAELIAAANQERLKSPPWKRLKAFPADEEAVACLRKQGLTLESRPAEGRWIALRAITSGHWGGEIEDHTARTHPDNVRLAIDAARVFGLTMAGIDLMTTDISQPWHANGAIINEMNFRPEFAARNREEQAAKVIPALVDGDGRIPVHLVTGDGDLLERARRLRRELADQGKPSHLTAAGYTEDAAGRELIMPLSTLFARSLALLMRRDVHALILVGRREELFERGLAVDRLESASIMHDDPREAERLVGEIRARIAVRSLRTEGLES